jgi:hypothetical protein
VIDVHMSVVLADGEASTASSTGLTDSITVGTIVYSSLGDGDNYIPVGLTTFT